MNDAAMPRRPDEHGVPDPFPYMHPTLRANYGNWDWHDRLRPGVLRHVAKSGDIVYTVRAGTQRQMDVFTIRKLADIGDQFADGHVRFTTRSNIEYMVTDEAKVAPLLRKMGKCLDTLLADCQVDPGQIGAVFLTGGTSLVPCVRDIFESRFPGRLLERDAFTSVGFGLGVEAGERFGAS